MTLTLKIRTIKICFTTWSVSSLWSMKLVDNKKNWMNSLTFKIKNNCLAFKWPLGTINQLFRSIWALNKKILILIIFIYIYIYIYILIFTYFINFNFYISINYLPARLVTQFIYFENSSEYLTRGTAKLFILLVIYLLQTFFSRSFLVLLYINE